MRFSIRVVTMCLASVGCGGDPKEPDAVTVNTVQSPDLVAFREDSSATWQTLPVAGKTTFEVPISGPYRLVIVCTNRSVIGATQYARTPADGPELEHECGAADRPFFVRGTFNEPGFVTVGDVGHGQSGDAWDFALPVAAGTYDVGMLFGPFEAPDHIALRRDLAVTADVTLPAADSAQAVAMDELTFTATNPGAKEALTLFSSLETAHMTMALRDTNALPGAGWTTALPPASVLQAGDRMRVTLTATSEPEGETRRQATRGVARDLHAGDATAVTLPDALGAVAFEVSADHFGAPLAGLPAGTDVTVWQASFTERFEQFWAHETRVSRHFLDETGAATAAVDFRDVPGFQDAWRIDPAREVQRGLDASTKTSARESVFAGVSEDLRPGALRARPSAAQLRGVSPGAAAALRRR